MTGVDPEAEPIRVIEAEPIRVIGAEPIRVIGAEPIRVIGAEPIQVIGAGGRATSATGWPLRAIDPARLTRRD